MKTSATSSDTWQTFDLSALGVPADAVVEVAVTNTSGNSERYGGVRAVGSSLERRFLLHEAESGGADAVTLHVQAEARESAELGAASGAARATMVALRQSRAGAERGLSVPL